MVLVDTSVWIDHLRRGNKALAELLCEGLVLLHPFVIGELACGEMRKRDRVLGYLAELPTAEVAEHSEVFELLESKKLHGRGLGWIDLHLLASALITNCALWTLDKPLADAVRSLRIDPRNPRTH